jgi:hypothetical protein
MHNSPPVRAGGFFLSGLTGARRLALSPAFPTGGQHNMTLFLILVLLLLIGIGIIVRREVFK